MLLARGSLTRPLMLCIAAPGIGYALDCVVGVIAILRSILQKSPVSSMTDHRVGFVCHGNEALMG